MDEDVYVLFIDLEKAFDTVNRRRICEIQFLEREIQEIHQNNRSLHENFSVRIEHEGELIYKINIRNEVRQGSLLSSMIFLIVKDCFMQHLTDNIISYKLMCRH